MIRANAFAGSTKRYTGIVLTDDDTTTLRVLQLDETGAESDWWQVTWKTLQFRSASYVLFSIFYLLNRDYFYFPVSVSNELQLPIPMAHGNLKSYIYHYSVCRCRIQFCTLCGGGVGEGFLPRLIFSWLSPSHFFVHQKTSL